MRARPGPRLARAMLCALAALPLACTTTQAEHPKPDASPDAQPESIWAYLAAKYDADGDGQVAAAEYDRGQDTFERLDTDGDGALTTVDFASDTSSPPMTREQEATLTVWRVFRRHQDMDVSRDELIETLTELDVDSDERLTWAELREALPRGGPGSGDNRFGLLKEVIDEDGDGALARVELLAFFDRRDSDGDAVLSMLAGGGRAPRDVGPPIGARPGDQAPDFSLPSAEGGSDVTLSGFRGDTPVALIFGSYT